MPRQHRVIDLEPTASGADDPAPSDGLSEKLTQCVRSIYVGCYREYTGKADYGREHMAAWDGGEDSFGHRHSQIWPRIAEKIVSLGVDPVGFIRAQFWCRGSDSRPPAPTYLLSDEAAARYGAYLQQAPAIARKDYQAYLRTVQAEVLLLTSQLHWEYKRAVHYALRNVVTVRASALFRYCFAVAEQLWDIAEYYHDQALLQYVFQQEVFDAAWGTQIPSLLREEGVRLRSQILGGQ